MDKHVLITVALGLAWAYSSDLCMSYHSMWNSKFMKFDAPIALTMKITSSEEWYVIWKKVLMVFDNWDEGSAFLWNVSTLLQDYMASDARR
jgi:hypothetical protein